MLGAVLMLLTQTIDQEHAIASIDFNTIGLLAGMMLMVKLTETTGVYTWLAIRAGQLSRGRPLAVVISLAMTTAVLSAFLDNLTTVLLVVPITFLLADALDIDPIPLVIIEIIVSNIGGSATLIGDPPNIIIAGATDLSFTEFIVNLAPIAAVSLRRRDRLAVPRLPAPPSDRRGSARARHGARRGTVHRGPRRADPDRADPRRDDLRLLPPQGDRLGARDRRTGGRDRHVDNTRQPLEDALRGIEWPTLFFFLGLFVMVGALEETGAIREVADAIGAVTGGDRTAELVGIAWVSAIGSGIVDNIPFTATMIPVVEQLQEGNGDDDAYWWALAIGACFGGNATLIAAAANVAAAGMAARAGKPIGFVTFLKAGIPATLLSMLLATAYIAVRYL